MSTNSVQETNDLLAIRNQPGSPAFEPSSANLTTVAQALAVDVSRASNVILHVKNTGGTAMAAGAFIFEASVDSTDGTDGTWFGLQVVRSNANTIETSSGTLALGAGVGLSYAWEASVNAYQWLRVRCTTATTGGSVASWRIIRGGYATEPIPAAQAAATQPVSGAVTATPAVATAINQVSTASTNLTASRAVATNVFELTLSNPTATPAFVKLYNKATAPVVASDVPVVTIPVPANSFVPVNFGVTGKRFATGVGVAITGAIAATDATASVAGVVLNYTYN